MTIDYKNLTDWVLVKMVKNDASSEAFLEICRRYQDVFYKICHRFAPALQACGVCVQDIFNDKDIIILSCIKSFKRKKKTKLSSWIGNHARFLCLNTITSKKYISPSCDDEIHRQIEEKQCYHEYFQNNKKTFKEARNYVFDLLSQLKDQRIKIIFEYRYGPKKMIWNKIAKKINMSPQTTVNLHKKGINLIRNKMKNENFIYDNV